MNRNLERIRRGPERPLVYGHRGARARAPENTIEAFDLALREGADGIELDVRMTSDGQLVILHDGHLPLGDGRGARVDRLSFAQATELGKRLGITIPTLDEALAWHRDTGKLTNVELKGDVPQRGWLAQKSAERIRHYGTDGILLSSFHPELVLRSVRYLPNVPVALLLEAGTLDTISRATSGWRLLGATGVHPQRTLLTPSYMEPLKRKGAFVNTWTVNDEEEAVRLADLGVDGIVTDRPLEILAALGRSR